LLVRIDEGIEDLQKAIGRTLLLRIGESEIKTLKKREKEELESLASKISSVVDWVPEMTFDFFLVFIPLTWITLIYDTAGRYPDERRKLGEDYGIDLKKSGLLKSLDEIKDIMDNLIEKFEELLRK
jgi:hypothetical protein